MARELHPGTVASLGKANYGAEERTRLCQAEADGSVAHASSHEKYTMSEMGSRASPSRMQAELRASV